MKWLDEKVRTKFYNPKEKSEVQEMHVRYMLSRTQSMFRYTNLPSTIPQRMLELYLQANGHCCIALWEGEPYAYTGGLGGEPDAYYRPTLYTVANPAQGWSKSLRIGEECVVIPNDSMYLGLLPLFHRYAYHLAENELSMLLSDVNSRMVGLISAGDDRTLSSARQYLSDIESGKLGIIGENAFLEGVKVQPLAGSSGRGLLQDLIEYEQYLKASWYNEIGLDSNWNMKRERLATSESDMNQDSLLPLVDDMLRCRQAAMDEVNTLFGTDIQVSLYSAWEDNQIQTEIVTEMMQQDLEGHDTDIERGEVIRHEQADDSI